MNGVSGWQVDEWVQMLSCILWEMGGYACLWRRGRIGGPAWGWTMRRRRLSLVGLIVIGLVWVALWLGSCRWAVIYQHRLDSSVAGPDFQTGIAHGAFYFTYHPSRHFGLSDRWTVGSASGKLKWWFKLWELQALSGMRATVIPLWSVAAAFLVPAAVLGVRSRLHPATVNPCPSCGYSLAGLPVRARCPECGARGARRAEERRP